MALRSALIALLPKRWRCFLAGHEWTMEIRIIYRQRCGRPLCRVCGTSYGDFRPMEPSKWLSWAKR